MQYLHEHEDHTPDLPLVRRGLRGACHSEPKPGLDVGAALGHADPDDVDDAVSVSVRAAEQPAVRVREELLVAGLPRSAARTAMSTPLVAVSSIVEGIRRKRVTK